MNLQRRLGEEAAKFGRRVFEIRKLRKFTQKEVSEKGSLTQPEISLIESGKSNFTFFTLIKLSVGLKVITYELFNYDDSASPDVFISKHSIIDRFNLEKKLFGTRLHKLIQAANITQDDVAFNAGVDPADLSRIVNGEHNTELVNMIKLADEFHVKLLSLIDYKGYFD